MHLTERAGLCLDVRRDSTNRREVPREITTIGHSTVLIETARQRVLTDPYFGGWGHIAYARLAPPASTREALRDVDLVLISHNHWDHTDRRFLRAREGRARRRSQSGAVGDNVARREDRHRDETVGGETIRSAQGDSGAGSPRGSDLWVRHRERGAERPFAGDTFYRPFVTAIGRRFQLDVALLPVTTIQPPTTTSSLYRSPV